MSVILIGLLFCVGFFIESIIGFGGTLVAFAILGFFVDIKELILMAIYVATCASVFVLASDHKSFSKEIFFRAFPFCLVGTLIGGLFFVHTSSALIIHLFGWFLLVLALKIILFDNIKLPRTFSDSVVAIGGLSQGVFGIGGPFFAVALKNRFENKSQMRATLAMFFISFNMVRMTQLMIQDTLTIDTFLTLWWVAAPLAIAIHLGHVIHKKISESTFKMTVASLAIFSGLEFLFKR